MTLTVREIMPLDSYATYALPPTHMERYAISEMDHHVLAQFSRKTW